MIPTKTMIGRWKSDLKRDITFSRRTPTVQVTCIICGAYTLDTDSPETLDDMIRRYGCVKVGDSIICSHCIDAPANSSQMKAIREALARKDNGGSKNGPHS